MQTFPGRVGVMNGARKELLVAYGLMFLGPTGVYRMYLRLWGTGLLMLGGTVTGIAVFVQGLESGLPIRIMMYSLPLAAMWTWWVLDLFWLPGMVRKANGEDERERSFVSLGVVNMDPSFSATRKAAGQDEPDGPQKSSLPEDYVRPWKQDSKKPAVYRPGED